MSQSDSFIEEVTEEVKRDNLFRLMRKWGWVGALAVFAIVGGTAFSEYRKQSQLTAAQALGDQISAAFEQNDPAQKLSLLKEISTENAQAEVILRFLRANAAIEVGDNAQATKIFAAIEANTDGASIYGQLALFKRLLIEEELSIDERYAGFETLAIPGMPLRILAEEQLA